MENYDQEMVINKAKANLEAACMARYAFTYAPQTGGSPPPGFEHGLDPAALQREGGAGRRLRR